MTVSKISVDHVARIEGHGNISLIIEDGRLASCRMEVVEPARFFESMVRGRSFEEIPYIASRICGICSSSHVVTDLRAIEAAFGVKVSERTEALRELLVYGSYLQNHATHLFVFAAPDFMGNSSVFPLADTDPELFERALGIKELGNRLCTEIGGRSVHPITAVPGGFTDEVDRDVYLALADEMEATKGFASDCVDLFHDFEIPALETRGDFLAMVKEGSYPVSDSDEAMFERERIVFDAADVSEFIEEYPVGHSAAFLAKCAVTKRPYMTAALARINASWANLSQEARYAAAKVGLRPPEYNPFRNNLAQAVELVDALDRCVRICRALADGYGGSSEPVEVVPKAATGVGFTEAPRGSLFHKLTFDAEGRVTDASILTPTAQNLANLEDDMRLLAESLLEKGASEDAVRLGIEKLVRAYDPCLSCSVH